MHPHADTIVDFLSGIGLALRIEPLDAPTFLPGVTLAPNALIVDPAKLLHPGDLLHEAGHLAVMTPERRAEAAPNAGDNMGDEIAAQAWSYAAAVHLGLPPEVVFHQHGYHGSAESLIARYAQGHAGVPLLQWMGLTLDAKRAAAIGLLPYPHMQRWLRP